MRQRNEIKQNIWTWLNFFCKPRKFRKPNRNNFKGRTKSSIFLSLRNRLKFLNVLIQN